MEDDNLSCTQLVTCELGRVKSGGSSDSKEDPYPKGDYSAVIEEAQEEKGEGTPAPTSKVDEQAAGEATAAPAAGASTAAAVPTAVDKAPITETGSRIKHGKFFMGTIIFGTIACFITSAVLAKHFLAMKRGFCQVKVSCEDNSGCYPITSAPNDMSFSDAYGMTGTALQEMFCNYSLSDCGADRESGFLGAQKNVCRCKNSFVWHRDNSNNDCLWEMQKLKLMLVLSISLACGCAVFQLVAMYKTSLQKICLGAMCCTCCGAYIMVIVVGGLMYGPPSEDSI